MKCNHCLIEFHEKEILKFIAKDEDDGWAVSYQLCPACNRLNMFLVNGQTLFGTLNGLSIGEKYSIILIRPSRAKRASCPQEVPASISEDYREACLVLEESPKASAALSRRCLQNLLEGAAKVKPGNLADEIQQVLDNRTLPSHLSEAIDAIRNIGNFAAHPMKSKSTGLILPVEPEEAEWNLSVLESLFDFYYVQPAILARKRNALNEKLKDAGKKPIK